MLNCMSLAFRRWNMQDDSKFCSKSNWETRSSPKEQMVKEAVSWKKSCDFFNYSKIRGKMDLPIITINGKQNW